MNLTKETFILINEALGMTLNDVEPDKGVFEMLAAWVEVLLNDHYDCHDYYQTIEPMTAVDAFAGRIDAQTAA